MNLILVMAGGFLGAICRFGISYIYETKAGEFPIGTLSINIIGCFLLGWLYSFARERSKISSKLILFIGTGFTGSFTTFSTFSVETYNLFSAENYFTAVLYIMLSIGLGLLFVYIGNGIVKWAPYRKGGLR
ncbi:fluoride efflux transporter CrcB [Peribacillus sp. SCS-155]|uniref:fluoride efflux transporter CrcB n=1 Tax=Peribacillus sedimenti TaxID=3115297 RepID=UPI00390586CB